MEYKLEKEPDARLRRIEIVSKPKRNYVASRKQSGSGDWTYEIAQILENREIKNVGTVVIDRPTQIIDSKAREAEVLQAIGNKIAEYEAQTAQLAATK